MNQYVIIFAFTLALVASQVSGQDQMYGKLEYECVRKGGMCLQKSECREVISEMGELCPEQAAQGFQCCLGLPLSEKRCHMRGGECFNKNYCNQRLVFSDATGCGAEQECCLLI